MKISYKWLKQYIDINLSVTELEEKMTFSGIEVEAVEKLGQELKQIKIAEIVEKQAHPESDHLSICQVNDGNETLQVICGAPNCAAGQKVAFASIGCQIGDFKIKKAKLRGQVSFGMLCSEQELGLSEEHDGIMVLPETATVGQDLASYYKLEDTCYDVEITPNRSDLLGMIGVARDLSSQLNIPVSLPEVKLPEGEGDIEKLLKLDNQAEDLCTRYTARMIKGVQVKDSPDWLKERLISVGLRPINNIVDVTNFVLMEYGHPIHAFDYNKIADQTIVVRRANDGEIYNALNDEEYKLNNEDLVIADPKKSIALAGVIGGNNSEIDDNSNTIVIEAANFLSTAVRKTNYRLKVSTDSAYRFERDIADQTAEIVSARAASLILEVAGGTLVSGMLDSYPNPKSLTEASVRPSRVERVVGIEIPAPKIIAYLEALGLKLLTTESDNLTFEVPAYRKDLFREIDLIEEIVRLHGYNLIPQKMKLQTVMDKEKFYLHRNLKNLMVNHGFSEVINWAFADPEDLDKLKLGEDDERRNSVKLKNPLGSSFAIMRTTLIPNLLRNSLFNLNHGNKNLKMFEFKKTYRDAEKLADEKYELAGLLVGSMNPVHWQDKARSVDYYDVKGVMEEMLEMLGVKKFNLVSSEQPFYQPGQAADVVIKKQSVASFGKLDPKVAESFDIDVPVYVMDLKVEKIMGLTVRKGQSFSDIPKFPPALRDISFQIARNINFEEITKAIISVNPGLIRKAVLFDEYMGKGVTPNHRSLSFSLELRSDTKTLTEGNINKIFNKVVEKLKKDFNIEMR